MAEPALALWPLIATMAMLVGARWRTTKRRNALNRAMHELRRPLQALALGHAPSGSDQRLGPLDQALVALDDLDAAINGVVVSPARRPVAARPLVEASVSRWIELASARDLPLELEWKAGAAIIQADPPRVAQALDNLLANAIEHGAGPVRVVASRGPVGLSLSVASRRGERTRRVTDPRRGHGLAVVDRVATSHLGRFRLHESAWVTRAELELPLAPSPLPAVPIEWAAARRRAAGPVSPTAA